MYYTVTSFVDSSATGFTQAQSTHQPVFKNVTFGFILQLWGEKRNHDSIKEVKWSKTKPTTENASLYTVPSPWGEVHLGSEQQDHISSVCK